jgi:tetratricopeptide (TPR) repeat protein
VHVQKHAYAKAIEDYTRIISAFGSAEDDTDTSSDPDEKIIRFNPTDDYRSRAQLYIKNGDYDAAIADYTQVMRLNPTSKMVYQERGDAFVGKGDYDAAIADYTTLIHLDHDEDDDTGLWHLFEHKVFSARGKAYAKKGNDDAAIEDFTYIIDELRRSSSEVWQARGEAYKRKGDNDAADADFAKVKELESSRVDYDIDFDNIEFA